MCYIVYIYIYLVGFIAYRFLLILCSFLVFFFVEPENDIRFLEKSIIKIFNFKDNFSLFNTEETKSISIPVYCM